MSVSLSRVDGPGDAELIAAVRGGDVDAYGELFARHVDAARRLAGQLAGPGDADDLVSDAFTKVLTVLQRGGGPDLAFRAYLLTAVRRLHVDRIRSGSRLRPVDDLTPFDPGVPFHDTAVEGFDNATAARAFASLPERWQMVLWHTEVEQQKPADIAVLLGMSANSVSALAYRAREGLRQAFLSMHAADPDDVDCGWTRDHLGAYVRGGLSRRDVARVDDHLEDCRACAAVYLELTEVNSGLSALLAPLLLGTAGAAYLSSTGAAGGVTGLGATWAATRSWLGSHTVVTAVGGVMAASVASVAIYVGAQTILANPAADTSGVADHPLQSISQSGQPGTSGPGQGRGNQQPGRANGQTAGADPTASGSPSVPATSLPTSSDSATDPLGAPTTDSTTDPGTDPTGGSTGPTDPTSDPTSGTPDPGAGAVQFTSTPPIDPEFGSTYTLRASGGSGKGIVFSIDPATTRRACSLDNAGTTVTFDHAGTCVISAHATTRSAARAVAALGVAGRGAGVSGAGASGAAGDPTQTVQVPRGRQHLDFQLGNSARVGDRLPLSATRGASGRPVTFEVDNPDVCAINAAGTAVTFQHAVPCAVTAHEDGDDDYHAAPDLTRTVDVGRGDQHLAFRLPGTARVGDTLPLDATPGASGQPVTYTVDNPDVCAITGAGVTFQHARPCSVTAHQDGNADYLASPEVTQPVDVGKGDQHLAFQLPGTARVGDTLPLDATPGASGQPVTYTVDNPDVCAITGAGVTFQHARPCSVTAHQDGNADYLASPEVTQPVDVGKGDQHLDFTLTSDRAVVSGTGTLAVTARGDSGNPVTFTSTTPGACTVTGTAVTFHHAQACSVEATQAGNDDYNAATADHSLQVDKADQQVAFTVTSGRSVVRGTGTLTVTAQGDSGSPVTFTSTTPDLCTVTGSTVAFDHAGACVIAADQAGNDDYLAAPTTTRAVTIDKAAQSISFTLPASSALGSSHDLAATGGGSGNPVTFATTTPAVCTVAGTAVTFDHAGACVIAADQAGNDDYLAATTATQSVDVAKAKQAITFTSQAPVSPRFGDTYAVSATGGDSGKPVTFSVAPATTNSACTVAGSTVTFRHAGTCVIAADQAGNDDYLAANTTTQSVDVAKAKQAITFTSKAPTAPAVGDTYAVSATGGDSGKPVTFSVAPATTNSACTVAGSTVTFRHAGTCVIAADQAGNDDYLAANTTTQSVDVAKAKQAITFTSKAPTAPAVGDTYAVSATGGDSGKPVTFSVAPATTNSACTVAGSTVTFRHAGTCVIAADQAGNDDYLAAPTVTQAATVQKASQKITITSKAPSPGFVGTTYDVAATGGGSGNAVVFGSSTPTVCTVAGSTVSFRNAGTCTVTANQAGNADYEAAPTVTQSTDVKVRANDLTMNITTRPGWLFGVFGTVVDVQVVGLDPGAHATLHMTAHHAIALSPSACDPNGDDNHSQCAVTNTPTTFSFLGLAFQSNPTLEFEVTSKDTQDSNPNDNSQTVQLGN